MSQSAPDFFIVGHPKCGTTAIYEMLKRHPQVHMPFKEPQYFAEEERYRHRQEQSLSDYLALFAGAGEGQRVGEASVLYLWSHTAAARIAEFQPRAQIIAIIREPASFLRSLHLQFVQGQVETEGDFRKALSLEGARRKGEHDRRSAAISPQMLLYSDYVRYVEQLRRYREHFPPERMLVLIYDDFRNDNRKVMKSIFRFLGVDELDPVPTTEPNPTVQVRSQRLDRMLRSLYMGQGPVSRAAKSTIKAIVPSRKLRRRTLERTQHGVLYGAPPPPDEELMAELRRRFKPEVVALGEFLDRDLVALWEYDDLG